MVPTTAHLCHLEGEQSYEMNTKQQWSMEETDHLLAVWSPSEMQKKKSDRGYTLRDRCIGVRPEGPPNYNEVKGVIIAHVLGFPLKLLLLFYNVIYRMQFHK